MRVLIVQPHMTVFGGAETVVLHLARCLRKLGVQNAVLTLTVSESMRELDPEIEYIVPSGNFTFMSRSTSLKNALGIIPELRALKKTIRRSLDACDILHPHNFPATWAVGRRPRKPVVWMCNEVPDLYNNPDPSPPLRALRAAGLRLDRRIVNTRVSEIVVADEANAAWVKRRYGRESRIISYGIEYERFQAGDGRAIRRRYGLDDAFVMLQVGMLTPQKNQMASLEALMGVLETVPRATLILAGDDTGPYAGEVRRVVAENKLKGRVIFTGQISKKDVADYYHACDVALFPVRAQGGWLAPFEALSAGRPVVVSDTMGAARLIRTRDLGVVTGDYAEGVIEVFRNREAALARAERGRRYVVENLTWEKFAEKHARLYASLLEAGRN